MPIQCVGCPGCDPNAFGCKPKKAPGNGVGYRCILTAKEMQEKFKQIENLFGSTIEEYSQKKYFLATDLSAED